MRIDDKEKERRRRLVNAHMDAEHTHDMDAIMATFAPHAVNTMNEIVATDAATTRFLHESAGWGTTPGAMSDLHSIPEAEYFTDYEIVIVGRLHARHTGVVLGYPPPTFREIEPRYVAFYRFDENDLLVSERVRLDLSLLYAPRPLVAARMP